MAKTIYEGFSRAIADEASAILGYDIADIMFNGPAETLNQTQYSQPAILTASVMILDAIAHIKGPQILAASKERGRFAAGARLACVAGHSVGEYAALVASGCVSFETALKLLQVRGRAMDEASPKDASGAALGGMCAILGLDADAIGRIIREHCDDDEQRCAIANCNCPGQIVITGLKADVDAVGNAALASGAKRAVQLSVSGPFHSKWMQPAADRLLAEFAAVALENPQIPVISNVTAQPMTSKDDVRRLMPKQVISPVLWEDCVHTMGDMGVERFFEIGNGTVLSGISKRCIQDKTFVSIQNLDDVNNLVLEL
jgi:[acyl-carrier-protein] S-malonyltransferase